MSLRRLSLSAGYHAIPQPPLASNPAILSQQEAQHFDQRPGKLTGTAQMLPSSVKWAYFVLGAAMLLGWNLIINSLPYFLKRMEGSPLKHTLSFYLSSSSTLTNFLFLWYTTVTSTRSSVPSRIMNSIIVIAVLNLTLALSSVTYLSPNALGTFILLNGIGQAAAASYLQTALMALASLFGSTAVQAVMSGQAAVGVLVSLVQLASTTATIRVNTHGTFIPNKGPDSTDRGALAFFGLATLFMVASLGAHLWITRTKEFSDILITPCHNEIAVEESSPLVGHNNDSESLPGSEYTTGLGVSEMLYLNKTYNFSVALVYVVTLAVFPPITTSIMPISRDDGSVWTHPLFFQSAHFLFFNVGDLLGRFVPSYPPLFISSPRLLLFLSLSRVFFIPLFLLCNISSDPTVQPFFDSDTTFFLLVFLLGASNGYLSCAIMVAAPSLELNPLLNWRKSDVDTAATVASFSLVFGLVVGSFLSFGVRAAVCGGCNPFLG